MTGTTFICLDCKQAKPIQTDGGTGYASSPDGQICYACCALRDQKTMETESRIDLYWNEKEITNWPGTMRFKPTATRTFKHNICGKGTTVYFRDHAGNQWSGRHLGDNQILRCRKISERASR